MHDETDGGWHAQPSCVESYRRGYEAGRRSVYNEQRAMKHQPDDPEMDATDFAHPAWWRGNDHAHEMFVFHAKEILLGKTTNNGTCSEPWESLRQSLFDIRTLLALSERIINTVRTSTLPSMCGTTIQQWYKTARDLKDHLEVKCKSNT